MFKTHLFECTAMCSECSLESFILRLSAFCKLMVLRLLHLKTFRRIETGRVWFYGLRECAASRTGDRQRFLLRSRFLMSVLLVIYD